MKITQKRKNCKFSKLFKFFKKRPNRILSSGKNGYRDFWSESKKWHNIVKRILVYHRFSCQGGFFHVFEKLKTVKILYVTWGGGSQKIEKIDFFKNCWDLTPMSGRFRKGIVVVVSPLKRFGDHFRPRDKICENLIFRLFFLYKLL